MWNSYNVFRRFCAFVIGMVFFLSGILKLLDPVGTGLVVAEYYKFLHLGFLSVTSVVFGSILAFAETILGVALMAGLWRKVISIVTFCVIGVFTVLTIVLLIVNPEMDCGCFGEAIHLTHLQSFLKNVILLGLAFVAFIPGRLGKPRRRKYVAFGIVSAFVVAFGIYSLLYIPLVDFTDFRPGARLEASMETFGDSYSATFIYERDGEERSFTLEDLPDSTWTYVRTETVRTERNDDHVASLSFTDEDGAYADRLAAHGDVIAFSIYNVQGMNGMKWGMVADGVRAALQAGFTPLVLVSADGRSVGEALSGDESGFDPEDGKILLENLYTADYKTLLTMNRSNGGATCFHNGTLVTKWARRSLPSSQNLTEIIDADMPETLVETSLRRQLVYEGLLVVAFGILFFV